MTLGNLIRTQRSKLGMSLDYVARFTGMSKSNLSRIERDMLEPGIVLCAQLSVLLRVPLKRLAEAALETT